MKWVGKEVRQNLEEGLFRLTGRLYSDVDWAELRVKVWDSVGESGVWVIKMRVKDEVRRRMLK